MIRIQHIINNGEASKLPCKSQVPLYDMFLIVLVIPRMSKLDKELVAEPEYLVLRQKMKSNISGAII